MAHPCRGQKHYIRKDKVTRNLKLATWNVRTLGDTGSRPERSTAPVARELKRYDIDIAALSETRLAETGQLVERGAGYTFYWQGRAADEPRQSGVGFVIKNSIAVTLPQLPKGISDRLIHIRIPLASKRFLSIVSAYAPTMTNEEEVKERFYQDLDQLLLSIPAEDKIIVMGDFNAQVGQNGGVWKSIIGKHGVGKENSNGNLLLSECAKHDLAITNTFFRLPAKKRTTWMHPRSKQWHLIDSSPNGETLRACTQRSQ